MKKFVICTNSCGLYLTDEHVAWLRDNGHPEADNFFGENDRSNPDLIACIEAIRASKLPIVEKAVSLIRIEEAKSVEAAAAKQELSAAIDAFVELVCSLGCRASKNRIILAMRRPAFENMPWDRAAQWFAGRFGFEAEPAKEAYERYIVCYNHPAIAALSDATREIAEYCEANSLRRYFNAITVDDGFEVKYYDETRFTASLCKNYAEHHYDTDYEFMELKPFLTRDTVAAFVDAGDTDGMMDYLKSLNVGGFMDIRDNREHNPTNRDGADVTTPAEEITQLLAELESIAAQ